MTYIELRLESLVFLKVALSDSVYLLEHIFIFDSHLFLKGVQVHHILVDERNERNGIDELDGEHHVH